MIPKPKRLDDREAMDLVKGSPCLICQRPSDPCHIKTRGSGGPDIHWNMMPLCRQHHGEQGQSTVKFLEKYAAVRFYLKKKGWRLDERGRLEHPELIYNPQGRKGDSDSSDDQ